MCKIRSYVIAAHPTNVSWGEIKGDALIYGKFAKVYHQCLNRVSGITWWVNAWHWLTLHIPCRHKMGKVEEGWRSGVCITAAARGYPTIRKQPITPWAERDYSVLAMGKTIILARKSFPVAQLGERLTNGCCRFESGQGNAQQWFYPVVVVKKAFVVCDRGSNPHTQQKVYD